MSQYLGRRPRLAFVSPVFLFPADAGGKIRTGNVLKGMKGGAFEITLLAPATAAQQQQWQSELAGLCDHFVRWEPSPARARWQRVGQLFSKLPVNVANDRSPAALQAVERTLGGGGFDLAVFDFVHAAVLRPPGLGSASLCFTHNVETEIFERHAQQARRPWQRALWRSQSQKMRAFERQALSEFTRVVAVSERDARHFREELGLQGVSTIPTGVDLDFFAWQAPPEQGQTVVFTGSMDWEANVDGVRFFLDQVWPLVLQRRPQARFKVVGRNPPPALRELGERLPGVQFTGFVDDVRPHAREAQAFVIPLRVGGGTRIKAFEAMAMGVPVLSTRIGMEGLEAEPGRHYLCCDEAPAMAQALLGLLDDAAQRLRLSRAARELVEARFGHAVAARAFEQACLDALRQPAPLR